MAKPARNMWDELEQQVRQWIKEIEQAFNPKHPERARVPIPVRPREDRDYPQR
jgi:hypothetical protein